MPPLSNRKEQLDAVIRTAQYLAGLTSQQDIWAELGRVAIHFLGADLAAFAARRPNGKPVLHRCEPAGPACVQLSEAAFDLFRQVLESGFLASEQVALDGMYAVAVLPLSDDGQTTAAMAIGHRMDTPLPRDTLNLYLAVAGLFSSTLTRLSSQHRFFALADNVPEMLFQLLEYPDGTFQFTYVSGGSRRTLGLAPEELLQDAGLFMTRLAPEERSALRSATVQPHGRVNRVFRWRDLEEHERHLLLNAMPTLQEDGTTVWDGAMQDVTERERLEEERKQYLLRLEKSMEATVEAMASTIEMRDPYTAGHQRRVTDLARRIGQEMGLSADEVRGISLAASVHDVGKIHVPGEILSFPGPLGRIEYELVKTHPKVGYDLLKAGDFPWPVAEMVLQHHERLDGSGYPQGLKGDQIVLGARIIAVADVVESIASYRPYRPALGLDEALAEITRHRGVLYDPAVVDASLRLFHDKGYRIDVA